MLLIGLEETARAEFLSDIVWIIKATCLWALVLSWIGTSSGDDFPSLIDGGCKVAYFGRTEFAAHFFRKTRHHRDWQFLLLFPNILS